MKKYLVAFFLVLTCVLYGQPDFNLSDIDEIVCKEGQHAEKIRSFTGHRNEFAHETDMHYQVMYWEIDPEIRYIKGDITYYFRSLVPDLTRLILDFSDDLIIKGITRNGDTLNYDRNVENLLSIHLDKTLPQNGLDTLRIVYEGVPPSGGFGSFEKGSHDGVPIIWTLSEPYGAKDWWPAKQDLIDKVDSVDIYIKTPISNLAASNGKLVGITPVGGQWVHEWKHRYPIVAYLIALSVTNYASYSDYVKINDEDSIEILNYVYPESLASSMQSTKSSIDIMQLFNELFGIYPFAEEKYGHAQFGWGGGEEHQTMSFMGNFSFGLQAHEMAHQWFGNKVTCGSWRDIWLNEGFATYLTGLTLERFSPDEFWPLWKNSTSNSATSRPGGSVWVDDTTSVPRIFDGVLSYNKGAYLLHMLRWIMGDSTFYAACNNYLNGAGTAYDFATTDELQSYFESTSGKELDEFFEDWFYGQGWPSYQLQWQEKSDSIVIWLGQIQSHPSVDFFEMPVPLLVVINDSAHIFRANHEFENQRFSFYTGGEPVDSVGFDPDKWILSRNNTITELITSVSDPGKEDVIIYPNPASDYVEVITPRPLAFANAIDLLGRIHSLPIHQNRIDLQRLEGGIYTIILLDEQGEIYANERLVVKN